MLALWRSMVARDYRADLAALQVPLLAVLGGDSNLYDAALLGRWFQQNVPGAQVASYPKAGHAPHADAPARFARDIAAFAAQRTPPSRNHVMVVAQNGASVPRPALGQGRGVTGHGCSHVNPGVSRRARIPAVPAAWESP